MIKFVNLETGVLFNTPENYIFWFPGGQSTQIFNTDKIGFISDKSKVTVSLPENNIFHLIDITKCTDKIDVNDVEYDASYKTIIADSMELTGIPLEGYYLYIIYMSAFTTLEGEWIENLLIHPSGEKEASIYKIGIDAYNLDESLYINLSNNGIEIPNIIQKAIYDSNVHEDNIDNILMNRKWKELLSNLWDTLSNRGSYKSLVNSLKWFGYDNNRMKLYELWRHKNNFEIRDINAILGPKYFETLNGVAKTTYIAIQYMMSELGVQDGKLIVKPLTDKITREDLMLKIRLLGAFYQKYFMPIHLDLYMATITGLAVSDTPITINYGAKMYREDFVNNVKEVTNDVDGKTFYMDALNPKNNAFVFSNTIFHGENTIVGVDTEDRILNENELETFWKHYSRDNGAIVPFKISIPGENIISTTLYFKRAGDDKWIKLKDENTYNELKFNLLCVAEGRHQVRMQIMTDKLNSYISSASFDIVNPDDISLKLYTVEHVGSPDFIYIPIKSNNAYMRRFFKDNITAIPQAISVSKKITAGYKGIYLNHLLIIKNNPNSYISNHYNKATLPAKTGYETYISKEYCFTPDYKELKGVEIERDDYIFVPEYHTLKSFGEGSNIDNYTIDGTQTLCVIPECIYNHLIENPEWIFENVSTGEVFEIDSSVEPFISGTADRMLAPGYYNIKFNYKLSDNTELHTIILDSAFRKI